MAKVTVFLCKSVSTVDYFLASPNLFEKIDSFQVHDFCPIISDVHCLISLNFTFQLNTIYYNSKHFTDQPRLWDSSKTDIFKSNLNVEEIRSLNEAILQCMSSNRVSQNAIDDITDRLSSSILTNAENSFGKIKPKVSNFHETPKWFGPKCSKMRKQFHNARYNYKLRNTTHNKNQLKMPVKNTKRLLNTSMPNFVKKI